MSNIAISQVVALTPMFPPSFDGSPIMFGLTLFGRSLLLILSAATVVRMRSKLRTDAPSAISPAYYRHIFDVGLLSALFMGSLSDVITWLAWGEVTAPTMGIIMTIASTLNALSAAPFCLALFVPFWMYWLRRLGVLQQHAPLLLDRKQVDLRVTWTQASLPVSLALWCFVGAAGVTVAKYLTWVGALHHAAH